MRAGLMALTVMFAAAGALFTTSASARGNVDRSYDPVKSMYHDFQQVPISEAKEIEDALRVRGYDPGVVDGVLGPMALRALERFQERHGLIPSGRPDAATVAALGLDTVS